MNPSQYVLVCSMCRKEYQDDGFRLECDAPHGPALLVTRYAASEFVPDPDADGIYRYRHWLPASRRFPKSARTVTYQSEALCRLSGLANLWIGFSGFWPERGANLETATFKELEAYGIMSRIPASDQRVVVVATAGNTGAAFARVCSEGGIPSLIVVPSAGMERMRFVGPLAPCVKIISLVGMTDYYDAITLAGRISKEDGFWGVGGVQNVGRRDGMGTAMLSAVEAMGCMPDYYFQAVGSGAGGIACHDTAKRLVATGAYGKSLPRLMLSQNLPFIPMYLSWKADRQELIPLNREDAKRQIRQIVANVLSNRGPCYGAKGGTWDALTESQGDMFVADNSEATNAADAFESAEGIDIDPAAAVALSTLLKTAKRGIKKDARVFLHVTGGGWRRLQTERHLVPARAALQFDEHEVFGDAAINRIKALF